MEQDYYTNLQIPAPATLLPQISSLLGTIDYRNYRGKYSRVADTCSSVTTDSWLFEPLY